MVFDPMERMSEAQWHQADLRSEKDSDRMAKIARSEKPGLSVGKAWLRLEQALASAWIWFVCSWHAARAGQMPGRC